MNANRSAVRTAHPLAATLGVLLLAGCGSGAATTVANQTPAATTAASTSAPPVATPAPAATTSTRTPSATSTASSTGADVSGAVSSALGLYEKVPRNPQDPAAGYVWRPVSETAGRLSPEVEARLDTLRSSGYFGGGGCAEDYLTGTQNGLTAAPSSVSAHGNSDGTVTVLLRRPATPRPPDLTVVLAHRNGRWLATDLTSGDGPSIFAGKPHC